MTQLPSEDYHLSGGREEKMPLPHGGYHHNSNNNAVIYLTCDRIPYFIAFVQTSVCQIRDMCEFVP